MPRRYLSLFPGSSPVGFGLTSIGPRPRLCVTRFYPHENVRHRYVQRGSDPRQGSQAEILSPPFHARQVGCLEPAGRGDVLGVDLLGQPQILDALPDRDQEIVSLGGYVSFHGRRYRLAKIWCQHRPLNRFIRHGLRFRPRPDFLDCPSRWHRSLASPPAHQRYLTYVIMPPRNHEPYRLFNL